MVNAKAEIDHWPLDTGLPVFNGFPKSTDNYDLTSQKTGFSHNWIVSGGVQYAFDNFLVELNLSYERGLTNQTNAENRYADQELLNTYAYVPDDYKVNTWIISVNFLRNIARPVKK
jgi:long-subunit fatty acid transport protein